MGQLKIKQYCKWSSFVCYSLHMADLWWKSVQAAEKNGASNASHSTNWRVTSAVTRFFQIQPPHFPLCNMRGNTFLLGCCKDKSEQTSTLCSGQQSPATWRGSFKMGAGNIQPKLSYKQIRCTCRWQLYEYEKHIGQFHKLWCLFFLVFIQLITKKTCAQIKA